MKAMLTEPISAHADMLERVIANDRTLQMLSKVHARIMADVETEGLLLKQSLYHEKDFHNWCLFRM